MVQYEPIVVSEEHGIILKPTQRLFQVEFSYCLHRAINIESKFNPKTKNFDIDKIFRHIDLGFPLTLQLIQSLENFLDINSITFNNVSNTKTLTDVRTSLDKEMKLNQMDNLKSPFIRTLIELGYSNLEYFWDLNVQGNPYPVMQYLRGSKN